MTHTAATKRAGATTRVVGLLRSTTLAARVRDAIGAGTFDAQQDLRGCLDDLGAASCEMIVVQVDVDSFLVDNSAIVRLRSEYPRLPILAYLSSRTSPTSLVAHAVRAGASSVIIFDRDDSPFLLAQEFRQLRRLPPATRVYDAFAPVVDPACHPILRYAIDHLCEERTVDAAAREMGVDRKTLNNWLSRADHPPISEFLRWVRVGAAVDLLSESNRDASKVAAELGFPSGPALRAILQRYLNATTEVARRLSIDDVVARFLSAGKESSSRQREGSAVAND